MAAADAVISWPAIPIELVRAAGLRPVVVRTDAEPTPTADAHLEGAVFPRRLRQLVEAALTGRLAEGTSLLLPRTSESDYKCFLYLREFARRGAMRPSAAILLFDLLQSTGSEVGAHNIGRTRALFDALGGGASSDRLAEEIARTNGARAALRRLLELRRGSPRIHGAEVLPLIGAFWQLPPDIYVPMAIAAASEIARRPPIESPRVLLAGAPVDGPTLHRAIEAHGAVVVAETGPWGTAAAGDDVSPDGEPCAAIAAKYRRDAWGPRTPLAEVRRWIADALTDVDAVVVSLPPEDAVFGWDYPWLRDELQARGVPHLCLMHDPSEPIAEAEQDRLAALMRAAVPRMEAHRG